MKKNRIIGIYVTFIVLAVGLWFWSSVQERNAPATPTTNNTILFYGRECPHCKDVEKFIEDNKITEKVSFDSLEVWHNKANSKIMLTKAQECKLSKDQIGVPFLYAKGECFIGGPDVERFFKQEAGM